MPNTPVLGLPYPSPTAPADIPADIQALANSVSTTLAASGTALPASPIDGQEFNFVADATNGVVWTFRYRAASPSAHKWEFVGGAPLRSTVATSETIGQKAWVDSATIGPTITLPLAGDYVYHANCNMYMTSQPSNCSGGCGINLAGVAPLAQDQGYTFLGSDYESTVVKQGELINQPAATVAKLQYIIDILNIGGTATVRWRELQIWPVRVG
jgi:hypothetical protein